MPIWIRLVLIGISLALTACRSERQDVSRDDAIRHYLNQQNYEQAIGLLKEKLAENPDDATKIQLASAYSGSIGINTIDCFDIIGPRLFNQSKAVQQPSMVQQNLVVENLTAEKSENTKEERQHRAILAIEKELYKFASQASDGLDIAFHLPHVPISDRDRLMLSMALLSDIHDNSDQYTTAQLYLGILATVQFVNYLRDAVPPSIEGDRSSRTWYLSLLCQIDLKILLPNLSKATEFLTIAFTGIENAGRKSENPVYENLVESKTALVSANDIYQRNSDLFEIANWASQALKPQYCE